MVIWKRKWFKYAKNLVIGVGASLVMIGALGKINAEPWGGLAITIGLVTEAFLFLILGLIPPEKDYYWEKLYPGIDKYDASIEPLSAGPVNGRVKSKQLDPEKMETQFNAMIAELQSMSSSMAGLKALQQVDFTAAAEQVQTMNQFYAKLNQAMADLSDTVDDTRQYREEIAAINNNLHSLNQVYDNMLHAMSSAPVRQGV